MKNFLPLIVFLLSGVISNAQTKSDTESWLNSYLNQYNQATPYGTPIKALIGMQKVEVGWILDRYTFSNGKLLYEQIAKNTNGEDTSDIVYYIDLSKISKVNLYIPDNIVDHERYYFPTVIIEFLFSDPKLNVYSFNKITNQPNQNYDYKSGYYQISFYNDQILEKNIPNRIKKAFEHLAALYGAKPFKEVF